MTQIKKTVMAFLMGLVMTLALVFGVAFSVPMARAKAETLPAEGWTMRREDTASVIIHNGSAYWTKNTNFQTPSSILDYTEINGRTLSEINAETPGAITVTLQSATADIGSFFRVNVNEEMAGFNATGVGSLTIRSGWSHTDAGGTWTFDSDIYFVNSGGVYVRANSIVDISDAFSMQVNHDSDTWGTKMYYIHTSDVQYWTQQYGTESIAINENEWKGVQDGALRGGAVQMSFLEFNGTPIYDININDHGSYGSTQGNIVSGGRYAPILAFLTTKELGNSIKLQVPFAYPSGSGAATENHKSMAIRRGFFVLDTATNIKYEVNKDIYWEYIGGSWVQRVDDPATTKIKLVAEDAQVFVGAKPTDTFTGIKLSGNDYPTTGSHYAGSAATALSYAKSGAFLNYVLVDDQPINLSAISESYLNVWGKYGYFTFRTGNHTATKITVKAGCQIPTYNALANGANEVYVVASDATFIKGEDGTWHKQFTEIKTTVDDAKLVWDDGAFVAISLAGDDFANASNTYAGDALKAISYAQSSNFYKYIFLNGEAITAPGEAFLNVWRNFGYFTFRTHSFGDVASGINEITVKAGCQIPTYNALLTGASEVYVVTEDATFIKGEDGTWVKDDGFIDEGEYETSVSSVSFARDKANNWMLIGLTNKDYPSATAVYNFATTEEQMSALNLYDKIIVDGYTLRSRIEQHGNPVEAPKINLWQASCLGIRIAGAAGALDGAQKVTIRAGAQFPSYAYIAGGVEAYFITNEEFTFVNVGAESGDWERQYVAKFVADGETIATIPYLKSQGFTAPEVPEKEGCVGKWESYTANGNITVNAVYTERTFAYEKTNVKTLYDQDGFMIISLTNHDFPYDLTTYGGGGDPRVIPALKTLNFEGYVFVDGKEMKLGGDGYMNVWGAGNRDHISFYIDGYNSNNMPTSITLKKGTQFPSYAYLSAGTKKCYELMKDVTYEKVDGVWQKVGGTDDKADVKPSGFANHYTLSDLWKVSEAKSDSFKDGWETLTDKGATEESYRYGYLDSFQDFTLTFDFSFTGAAYYNSFSVQLGTEDHGGNKGHFGWRFYLLRGDSEKGTVTPDMCVEFFSATCDHAKYENGNIKNDTFGREAFQAGRTYRITIGYQLIDATKGTVRFYAAIDGIGVYNEAELGGDFAKFAPYLQSLTMSTNTAQTVTVSDPSYEGNFENVKKLTLDVNGKAIVETYTNGYVLPALSPEDYGMGGNVFVGWTTDTANLSNLYPAGYPYTPNENVTLYAVWLGFQMRGGAGVRIGDSVPSGIRFIIDVDKAGYELGVTKGLIQEIGTIVAPTSYLTDNELTHALGTGYYIEKKADKWQVENTTYTAALIGISADQYARSFSARGYLKIAYTTGDDGYIYTSYNEADHARSIYDVATAAYQDKYQNDLAVQGYVNAVADVTVSDDLTGATKNGVGNYTVSAAKNGDIFTLTVNNPVKAVVINGTRIVMGHETDVIIGGMRYTISGFTLNTAGTTISFTVGGGNETAAKKYYISLLENWKNRTDYTAEHYEKICAVADEAIAKINAGAKETWKEIYETAVETLEMVKTSGEFAANVGDAKLAAPVVTRGDGYEVTWNAVAGADYYIVYDSNDYRPYTVVKANETLSYSAYVVGNHEITVVAHSYFDTLKSTTSNTATTPEVKQAFTYKALSDGLYKFDSSQLSSMGLSSLKSQCYLDPSRGEYFVYYNVETDSWSPYPSKATDWSSPKYFLAHAKRLKEMGNNVLLIPYQTKAEFKDGVEDGEEADVWETSRLKYVMDTAWSIGMKVIVCDEALYKLSMSDGSNGAATSVEQVTNAINASKGFYQYIKHPAFFGFSFDDEPYGKYMAAMSYTIQAIDTVCDKEGVQPFYLACLFQAQGGELGKEMYTTQSSLKSYYDKWLQILTNCGIAKEKQYLYVDIYTQHAMDQPTDRYNTSYEVIYGTGKENSPYFNGEIPFYQALTAHTQNDGVLLEQDLYASMMYAAAHNVAGYSWFCFFPISGEFAGTLGGYDGNGKGNGEVNGNTLNGASGDGYYEAAKKASKQFEIMQGWLDGYVWKTRGLSEKDSLISSSYNLLTTTLYNEKLGKTVTIYVNADMNNMSTTVSLDGNKTGKLIGYGVNGFYEQTTVSSLAPGQAIVCGL